MNSAVTRRWILLGSTGMLLFGEQGTPVQDAFDHVLLGVSDLERGIAWFEQQTGVRAAIGGVHPGRGTRNALASLGAKHYLEIIAPDPAQKGVSPQFPLAELTEPRLINFAVRTIDIERTAVSLRKAGVPTFGPQDGSRRTASGALLRWKTLGVESNFQEGGINPIPFFIEWASDSRHPSADAPPGCIIKALRFQHPRAEELKTALAATGLEATVSKAKGARIIAAIQTPKGQVELE